VIELLRAGRAREAAREACRRARAGQWDRVVAATILVHARRDAPERADAVRWLSVPFAARDLEGDLGSPEAWQALLELLVDVGRLDEARAGLGHATAAGLVGAEVWLRLALHLCLGGQPAEAWRLVEDALGRFPRAAAVWAIAAELRAAHGAARQAKAAARTARRLGADSAGLALAEALIAAAEGDRAGARARLDQARARGTPSALVAGYARRCGLSPA